MSEKRDDSHMPSEEVAEHRREPKDGAESEGKQRIENVLCCRKRRLHSEETESTDYGPVVVLPCCLL